MANTNTLVLGIPPIAEPVTLKGSGENTTINDFDVYDRHFMSFTLIPLKLSETLGSNILEMISEDSSIPRVKFYPKEPPVITYTISNALEENWLSSIAGMAARFGALSRSLGLGMDASEFGKKLSEMVGIPLVESGIEVLGKALSGYGVAVPKVWAGSEWGIAFRVEIEEYLWSWGKNAPQRFSNIMNTLKYYVAPSMKKPTGNSGANNQNIQGQQTVGNTNSENQGINLANYFYSQPHYCKLVNGRNENNVIINAAIVSNVNINFDTKDMSSIVDQSGKVSGTYPRVLRIELEITPLHFSLVNDVQNELASRNIMSFEKAMQAWVPSKT